MSEKNEEYKGRGIKRILSLPIVYDTYQFLVNSHKMRKIFVKEFIKPVEGETLLDFGCGTGNMVPYLPGLTYYGCDLNSQYIQKAKERYGDKGKFLIAGEDGYPQEELPPCDIVIASGVLHHLDDNIAKQFLKTAKAALRPGGRLITNDPCFTPKASYAEDFFARHDRGNFVRTYEQTEALVKEEFSDFKLDIRNDMYLIPLNVMMISAIKS